MEWYIWVILVILIILELFSLITNNIRIRKTTLDNQLLLAKIAELETRLFVFLQGSFDKQDKLTVLQSTNITQQLGQLSQLNESKMENIRKTLHDNLFKLQEENSKKLDAIRATVEEKLQTTLERRLGESFRIVSDRLEMVHKGLGAMQSLASGVGDLKKVLTNVKTRGIWGEVQLDAILQQILTPEQYARNVAVKTNSQDRVEYAIKLPGKEENSTIWLPIDAKFPLDDYHRLIESQEIGNLAEIEKFNKLLEINLKKCAKTIAEKYINPPSTTDFAIMFLPIEGLYAEALRRTGTIESLQRDYRIIITSPITLCAILNSLQMGFKTIAIEKHSSHIWKVLESVKPEFIKFADLLSKTRIKLEQASQAINDAETKSRSIQKRLDKADKPLLEKT